MVPAGLALERQSRLVLCGKDRRQVRRPIVIGVYLQSAGARAVAARRRQSLVVTSQLKSLAGAGGETRRKARYTPGRQPTSTARTHPAIACMNRR